MNPGEWGRKVYTHTRRMLVCVVYICHLSALNARHVHERASVAGGKKESINRPLFRHTHTRTHNGRHKWPPPHVCVCMCRQRRVYVVGCTVRALSIFAALRATEASDEGIRASVRDDFKVTSQTTLRYDGTYYIKY